MPEMDLYGMDEGEVFQMAPKLYEPVDDPKVVTAHWFRGHIDRAAAEALITKEGVPGNFLVRQKDRSNRIFAHSYLSRSKKKVVHNLIELSADGQWLVDDKPFSGSTLDTVVDRIQRRLRGWRNLVAVDEVSRQRVSSVWDQVFFPSWSREDATRHLANKSPGSFVIRGSSSPGTSALSVRKPGPPSAECVWNAPIVESPQGFYLKFTEIIEPTLEDVVATMVLNTERTLAAGVPTPLTLPPTPSPVAAPASRAPPPLPPTGAHRPTYEVQDLDEAYDELPGPHVAGAGGGGHGGAASAALVGAVTAMGSYATAAPAPVGGAAHDAKAPPVDPDDAYDEIGRDNAGGDEDDMYGDMGGAYPPLPPAQDGFDPAVCEANSLYGSLDGEEGSGSGGSLVFAGYETAADGPPRPAKPGDVEELLYGDPEQLDEPGASTPPPRPPKSKPGAPPQSPRPAAHVDTEELLYGDPEDDGPPPPLRPPKPPTVPR